MDCTFLLEAAILARRGVLVESTDTEVLRRKLYQARQNAQAQGLDLFDNLSFRIDPRQPKTHLLILSKLQESSDG